MRRMNGGIIGPRITTSYDGASGIWGFDEMIPKFYSTGNWPTGKYSLMTVTYNFTSNNATVIFNGVTIAGNSGGSSSGSTGGIGGTYTITNNNGLCGGVNGGAGATSGVSVGSYANYSGCGGGAAGGGDGSGSSGGSFTDVSGFLTAYVAAGYTADGSFGQGGNGSGFVGGNGNIPGAGGAGGGNTNNNYTPGGTGANGMILIKYTVNGADNYRLVNQTDGAGSIIFPAGTSYVKAWAIGKGTDGYTGDKDLTNNIYYGGGGGGGAGFAYGEFI